MNPTERNRIISDARAREFEPRTEEADRFWRVRTPGLPLECGRPYPVNVPTDLHPSRPKHLPETITDDEIAAIRAMSYTPSPETTGPQPIGPIPAWVRKHWKPYSRMSVRAD